MREVVKQGVEKELTSATESITNNIVNTVDITIRSYLRGISEQNLQYVELCYQQFQLGQITEQQAKQKATSFLLSQSIGETGYPYVVDSSGVIRVHPKQPLINTSLISFDFIKQQIQSKKGYLEYQWKNPDELVERPKALYMVYFEPWDWIITSSSYREEFASLINIDDFSDSISKLNFDETGYSYVLNQLGDPIVHPFVTGNFYNVTDSNGKLFVQEIINKKNGTITYTWQNPHDEDFREKIAVFRYLPEYDWYIVSSTYVEELNQPLVELKIIHLAVLVFAIALVIPSNLMLSRSIVLPLKGMMNWISQASASKHPTLMKDKSGSTDELAQLTVYFNQFLSDLDKANQKLHKEIDVRIAAQKQLENLNENLENNVAQRTLELKQSLERLKQTQDQLIESEKLSALGGLVAGIAHEVNTPLGIAITSASLVSDANSELNAAFQKQTLTSEQFEINMSQQLEALELLKANLNRASSLVQSFKQTAVHQVSEALSHFVVKDVLESLIASLHPETRKVLVVPVLKGDSSVSMSSLPGALTQVFSNLILNSVYHAFEQQPEPQILIEFFEQSEDVVFIYQDNGCGVEKELHKKIFEPFYTTRRGSGGTGIGLNMVFNLVNQKLKGNLEFSSANGVKFVITLPKQVMLEE
ncbi:sensor histidine kinase [Vibrio sp. VPAP30]|uniref:sensor histidine kinase n=1 Tax=Vibrio sp. VPAP30 TaxID=1647102 RepID=UPI001F1BB286|nr:cache domain-containing protein [Vibrio sp. VPAP30]